MPQMTGGGSTGSKARFLAEQAVFLEEVAKAGVMPMPSASATAAPQGGSRVSQARAKLPAPMTAMPPRPPMPLKPKGALMPTGAAKPPAPPKPVTPQVSKGIPRPGLRFEPPVSAGRLRRRGRFQRQSGSTVVAKPIPARSVSPLSERELAREKAIPDASDIHKALRVRAARGVTPKEIRQAYGAKGFTTSAGKPRRLSNTELHNARDHNEIRQYSHEMREWRRANTPKVGRRAGRGVLYTSSATKLPKPLPEHLAEQVELRAGLGLGDIGRMPGRFGKALSPERQLHALKLADSFKAKGKRSLETRARLTVTRPVHREEALAQHRSQQLDKIRYRQEAALAFRDAGMPYSPPKRRVSKASTPLKTSVSEDDARKLIDRHGLKGPLPKHLTREQRMSAYEARYVSAGGRKAEKWQRRAVRADKVKNGGLGVATAGGAAWLGARTKAGGKLAAKVGGRAAHHAETIAGAGAVAGGSGELYAGHARRKRSSYASAPAGVAASALRRMQGYTPT